MWFIVTDEATKYRAKIGPPPLAVVRSAALGALQALHGEPPRAATCSYPAPRSERSRRFNLSETGSSAANAEKKPSPVSSTGRRFNVK
jgi:hypothetical protein